MRRAVGGTEMTKYSCYATMLDRAFKDARKNYTDAAGKYLAAVKEHKAANEWFAEKFVGERESRRLRAKAALAFERDRFKRDCRRIWAEFDDEVSRIRGELVNVIQADKIASPSEVDVAAIELMKSGALDSSDFAELASKFAANGTMTKLIAKFAVDASDSAKMRGNGAEAAMLMAVSTNAKNGYSRVLQKWDELSAVAVRCSGRGPHGDKTFTDPEYVVKMCGVWEECAGHSVEAF